MKRGCGVLLPLFSLPAGDGIGDFGDAAYRFADLLADHGAGYWQILPLNPGNPDNGESPYFSVSAFAINPLLISLDRLRQAGLLTEAEMANRSFTSPGPIRYDLLRQAKLPLLEKAADRFRDTPDFLQFCQAHADWLEDFALFQSLQAERPRPWAQWPPELRERQPQALAAFAASRRPELRRTRVLQYFAWTQWQALRAYCHGRNLTVIGDMPIYVALESADTWAHPGLFKLDEERRPTAVSGVPPDLFSADGQLWNNPVYQWSAHHAEHYAWWIRRLRHMLALYDIVRIDHFRGLVQYWEIPAGSPNAIQGRWMDVPTHAFFDALMAAFQPFPVICEDLGIITDDVRRVMARYQLPGMKVLQFAFDEDDGQNPYLPHHYNHPCLVYTGTHDNLPTYAWLSTADAKTLKRIQRYTGRQSSGREMVWDLIELAMKSKAEIAVFPLQDLLVLDKDTRVNDPAKLEGNWRWRWNPKDHPGGLGFLRLQQLAEKYGRS